MSKTSGLQRFKDLTFMIEDFDLPEIRKVLEENAGYSTGDGSFSGESLAIAKQILMYLERLEDLHNRM